MNEPIEGIEAQTTEPTRAERATQATRMMEEAWAADAAAREAARVQQAQQVRPTGFSGASEFEPLAARPSAPPTTPPTTTPQQPEAPAGVREARATTPAEREFSAATSELEQAQSARQEADRELGRRLARIGPGLTREQTQSVTRQYREQNASVYQAEERAAERVSGLLQERAAELRQSAETPEGARTLTRGLAALAQSPRAAQALEFAGETVRQGGAAAEQLLASPNFGRDVLERGLPTAAAVMTARGLDPVEAYREVSRLAEPFSPAGEAREALSSMSRELSAMRQGNFDGARNLATRWQELSAAGRGQALASAAIGLGRAGLSTYRGESAAQQLEAWGRAGQGGAEVLSNLTRALGTGLRAEATATALARLAPGLGLLANAGSFAHNASQFMQTRNPGYAVAATGDAIATLGSAIGSVPIGAVPGAAVNAFGQAISAVGELGANYVAHRRSQAEQVQQLENAGLSRVTAQALVENPAGVQQLARQGFSPEQIQRLASAHPELFTRPADLQVFSEAARALGANTSQTLEALGALSRRELATLTSGLAQARTPAEQRAFLDDVLAVAANRFSPVAQAALRGLMAR